MWAGRFTKGRFAIPELPEVETVRRELEPWLTGRKILAAELVDAVPGPKYVDLERAVGATITAVNRRGKFLLLPLGEDELVIHLGMTGIITPQDPEKHVRVRLELSPGANLALYFQDVRRFGRFLVVPAGDYRTLPTLHAMGPEPLSDDFNAEAFAKALKKSSTPIKTYLLSQKPVAGVGNIYADEALWGEQNPPADPGESGAQEADSSLGHVYQGRARGLHQSAGHDAQGLPHRQRRGGRVSE